MKIKIKNIILFSALTFSCLFAQSSNDYYSNSYREVFGDYLFCKKDYLRAINEYRIILKTEWKDSLQFKIGFANFNMGKFNDAIIEYKKLKNDFQLIPKARLEILRSQYMLGNYTLLRESISKILETNNNYNNLVNLSKTTLLLDKSRLPEREEYLSTFNYLDKKKIEFFYKWKIAPPYKNPTKAALLSAIIPGAGKIYTGNIGDGITAFLFTGLFAYLSVNKFNNNHTAAGWLYASISTFFYAGNIYGSFAAAQNYNAKIKFDFINEVKNFIHDKKEYIPKPKLGCKE